MLGPNTEAMPATDTAKCIKPTLLDLPPIPNYRLFITKAIPTFVNTNTRHFHPEVNMLSYLKQVTLIQPKPVKCYDLREALVLFDQMIMEHQEHVVSEIPTFNARIAKRGALANRDNNGLPLHLRIVGGPVSGCGSGMGRKERGPVHGYTCETRKVHKMTVGTGEARQSSYVRAPAYHSSISAISAASEQKPVKECTDYVDFMHLSSPPIPPHKRHPRMMSFAPSPGLFNEKELNATSQCGHFPQSFEMASQSDWMRAPSPSQVPYPPSWVNDNKARALQPKTSSAYSLEGWIKRARANEMTVPAWMRAPSPSELPPPPKAGLALESQTDDSDSDDAFETASEGCEEESMVNEEINSAARTGSVSESVGKTFYTEDHNRADSDKGSVHDSGYATASPCNSPSSSTSDLLTTIDNGGGALNDGKSDHVLHWNISMGGDAVSFLLKAERDLQTKAKAAAQVHGAHKSKGSKLHWNSSMGGNAVSFLLNAERELRRKVKGKDAAVMHEGVV